MTCTSCGSQLSDAVKFCSKCGRQTSGRKIPKWWIWAGVIALLLITLSVQKKIIMSTPVDPADGTSRTRLTEGSIVNAKRPTICADTEKGFDEVIRWAARNDTEEMTRALLRYGGAFVKIGDKVKILDLGILKERVRILKTGRECWLVREAIDQ